MRRSSFLIAVVIVASALALGAPSLAAQTEGAEHPAEIRSGACANAGEVVAPLANLVVPAAEAEQPAPVGQSYTVVPVPLANLLGAAHMLVVYAAPESADPVACSDIGGALGPEGALALALNPVNGSRTEGVAYFAPTPAGDATAVTVLLTGSGGVRERERPEREREPRGEDPARAGEDGVAGIAGLDGADGADGADGQPGQPGEPGQPGQPGADGAPGGQGGDGGDGGDGGAGGSATGTSRA